MWKLWKWGMGNRDKGNAKWRHGEIREVGNRENRETETMGIRENGENGGIRDK